MSRILRRRPSPSMVVAFVALCVALAGTATALPGRARVKKDDIARAAVRSTHVKSRAIQSKHIKSRAVTRSKIARRAVGSSEVGQDALKGENIVESSLGTVPTASNASNATNATNAGNAGRVNGRTVQKFAFAPGPGTAATTVLAVNGLTVNVACNAGPNLSVRATTSVSGAIIHSGGTWGGDAAFYNADNAFNIGSSFDPVDEGATNSDAVQGTLTYLRADGEVVTATFLGDETPTGCLFAGTAVG
jgi:hypothetical protein